MSGMLMDERFVAVFPSLVRLLGSLEAAVILQHMHWLADDDGNIKVTQQQISDETGIALRTVERKVRWLRDEGYVTAGRSDTYDATLTYRIDSARLASTSSANGGLDSAKVADSEPAKVADSSIQKIRSTSTSVVTEESKAGDPPQHHATGVTGVTVEAETHPSRPITASWAPRPVYLRYLMHHFPEVDLRASGERFVNHYLAQGATSRSWEGKLFVWVSTDAQRIRESREGGTDDLGIPHGQRPRVSSGAQPGDEDYVDPEELHRAAQEAARSRPPRAQADQQQ